MSVLIRCMECGRPIDTPGCQPNSGIGEPYHHDPRPKIAATKEREDLAQVVFQDVLDERDRYREALRVLAAYPLPEVNPDGDEQGGWSMRLIAQEALGIRLPRSAQVDPTMTGDAPS